MIGHAGFGRDDNDFIEDDMGQCSKSIKSKTKFLFDQFLVSDLSFKLFFKILKRIIP